MQEINKEYIDHICELLESKQASSILKLLEEFHPADIAKIIEDLNTKEANGLFTLLDDETASDVLVELDEDIQQKLLQDIPATEIYEKFLEPMESDDAADIINELPEDVKEKVVNILSESKEEEAQDVIELLDYPEDTAGGLMAKERIQVNINENVSKCIARIQEAKEELDDIYAVYVVDEEEKLKGIIPLQNLVLYSPKTKIIDFFESEIISVDTYTQAEEVARIMKRYDLVVLPVVDSDGILVGRITIDDVVDFITEEAEEDYQLASGISEDVDPTDKIWVLSRARLPWLLLGLVGGVAASKVIGQHEASIKIYPEMAFFIPIITAMAGNAGIQSSAIVVQALAGNTLGESSFFAKIFKEFTVSFINGMICSVILLAYGIFFTDMLQTALTISISLLAVIILASTLGLAIPLLLQRIKIDPALATGPFITTTNDLIGLAVYFYIGHMMYNIPF
ncbi:MAG: magnesium transporter [Bacteroidetes bacterium]|nr:magnesium transporter [Bacteroidota bacterium]MBL6964268.1 magnesium transporter [Bacteroidota bacterium]